MLMRIGRRRSAWEEPDIVDVCIAAFPDPGGGPGLDLSPSVYALDNAGQVVQADAEHCASLDLNLRSMVHVNLAGAIPATGTVSTPGDSSFEFTRSRHREIPLNSEADLHEIVRKVKADLVQRRYEVQKTQLRDYVQSKMRAMDAEWTALCTQNPRWAAKWAPMAGGPQL